MNEAGFKIEQTDTRLKLSHGKLGLLPLYLAILVFSLWAAAEQIKQLSGEWDAADMIILLLLLAACGLALAMILLTRWYVAEFDKQGPCSATVTTIFGTKKTTTFNFSEVKKINLGRSSTKTTFQPMLEVYTDALGWKTVFRPRIFHLFGDYDKVTVGFVEATTGFFGRNPDPERQTEQHEKSMMNRKIF